MLLLSLVYKNAENEDNDFYHKLLKKYLANQDYTIDLVYILPQHFLNFNPLLQGHGSFLPIFFLLSREIIFLFVF